MKIVREHMNEKFVEDSDPVEDLGLGFQKKIDNYFETYYPSRTSLTARIIMLSCKEGYDNWVIYLLKQAERHIIEELKEDQHLLRIMAYHFNFDLAEYVIKTYKLNINKAISIAQDARELVTLNNLLLLKEKMIASH